MPKYSIQWSVEYDGEKSSESHWDEATSDVASEAEVIFRGAVEQTEQPLVTAAHILVLAADDVDLRSVDKPEELITLARKWLDE